MSIKNLYETTRRRRVYEIVIEWNNQNKAITITNKNPKAEKIDKARAYLSEKESAVSEYTKIVTKTQNELNKQEEVLEGLKKDPAKKGLVAATQKIVDELKEVIEKAKAQLGTSIDNALSEIGDLTRQRDEVEAVPIDEIRGLKVDFDYKSSCLGGTNSLVLNIYNLRQELREFLYQDFILPQDDEWKTLTFKAGYEGDGLSVLFSGDVRECYSYKQGNTDVVTRIMCTDVGLTGTNRTQETALSKETTRYNFITKELFPKLVNVVNFKIDIDNLSNDVIRKNTVYGKNIVEEIERYAINKNKKRMNVYYWNKTLYILNKNSALPIGDVKDISSDMNIIGTPKKHDSNIEIDLVFEPRLRLGQLIKLNSQIESAYQMFSGTGLSKYIEAKDSDNATGLPDGFYKVINVDHKGSFNDSGESNVTTHIVLLTGSQHYRAIQSIKI